jgi:hypothetical protein
MTREHVIAQYSAAFEKLAIDEQLAVARGDYALAQYAHGMALALVRAINAEEDDPEPQPTCVCVTCQMYRVGLRRLA